MWKNPKYFYVSYVSTKSYGICFISPIKQPELTNFLLAFWLKNTFHFPLSWLSMVPIFINCVKKNSKLMSQGCATLGLSGGQQRSWWEELCSVTAWTKSHQSDNRISLSGAFYPLAWKQRKESPNKQSIELLCKIKGTDNSAYISSKHFPTRIHCSQKIHFMWNFISQTKLTPHKSLKNRKSSFILYGGKFSPWQDPFGSS